MEEPLRKIAAENVSNRRKSGLAATLMGVISLPMFIMVLKTEFQNIYWIIGTIGSFALGFIIAMHYEKKIVGKKTAVDLELERLKNLYPSEKLELPKIDEDELKLRDVIRRSNREDMI